MSCTIPDIADVNQRRCRVGDHFPSGELGLSWCEVSRETADWPIGEPMFPIVVLNLWDV